MRGRHVLAATLCAAALLASFDEAAWAQDGKDETEPTGGAEEERARARALANEGLTAYRRGDYATALAKFEQAQKIVSAPTIGLHHARCLDKLGRIAEALARYTAVTSATIPPDAPYVHHRAKQDAVLEMQALELRVPTLVIEVEGDPGAKAELIVDGRAEPYQANVAPRRLDPGPHTIEVRRTDGTKAAASVQLVEKQRDTLRLVLPPPKPGGESEASIAAAKGDGGIIPWPWESPTQRTAGWISVATAGVGLSVALITGGAALAVGGDLDAQCPNGECPPSAWDDVDTHDGFRTASTVGWIVAGAFGAAGAVLILTAPDDEDSTASARATVGPRGVSVRVDY
jgi:hypothetical protein